MNDKNDLLSKINIVDVIGNYITLTPKKGKPGEYEGKCPFHKGGNERKPSFNVSEDLQVYNCWSCPAKGNVITFLKEIEHIDGSEAYRLLAEKAGVKLSNSINKINNKYEKFYEMYDIVHKYFINNMNSVYAKDAKEYLNNRHIDNDMIKEYKIGFSLNKKNDLTKLLQGKGYDLVTLNDYGLTNKEEDVFYDRIMFPLYDLSGKVVGFSGRRYDGIKESKYVNTKVTNIFKKGEIVYNYYNAKGPIKGNDEIIVMEGFMAVIRSCSIGIKNVVGLMSVNMTDKQALLISNLSKNVILAFDGDEPGREACLINGDILENMGCNVRVVLLSDDLDPDDYIIKYGSNAFHDLVNNAISLSDYRIKRLRNNINLNNEKQLLEYIDKVLLEIGNTNNAILIEKRLKNLEKEVNISYNRLEMRLSELKKEKKSNNNGKKEKVIEEPNNPKTDKYFIATYSLLYYMITNKLCLDYYNDGKINFINEDERYLASEISYYVNQFGSISFSEFLTYIEDKEELKKVFDKCFDLKLKGIIKEDVKESEINSYINTLREYQIKTEIKKIDEEIKNESDVVKQMELLQKIALLKSKI